jgi:hypothetical protein
LEAEIRPASIKAQNTPNIRVFDFVVFSTERKPMLGFGKQGFG